MFRVLFVSLILLNFLYAKEDVNLQLSWKNQFQFAGYYMAKEKGFYSDANLNVNIKEFASGVDASNDVVNGKADFGVGRSSLICDRYDGKPITLLAAVFQHSPVMLLTKKRDDIRSVADLKDKKIMLSGDLATSAPINAMLQSKKVTQDMFTIQSHSFNVQDLIDGKTDAMLSYVSNEPYAMQKQNIPYTIFSPKDYNFDFYSDILFTSQDLLKKNPKLVKAFREASLKGWKYALEHKEETVDLILEKYNTQNRTKDALLFEANEIEKLVNQNEIELGNIDPKRIEYITQIYALMGFIDTEEKVRDFIYKVEKSLKSKVIDLTDKEKIFIQTHPKIVLGADQNWKPFDWKDKSGNHAGFDADFTRLLEEKLGINIEVKLGDWGDIQKDVKDKKIDGIIGASKNAKRDKYMLFTDPYFMFDQVVLVDKENKDISLISDLDGKTIALKEGSSDIKYFKKKYPNIAQKLYKSDMDIIVALSANEVDAALSNIGTASYEIERSFISNVKVAFHIDELSGDMRYGIRNDQPELVSILQKGINAITKNEIDVILGKWVKLAVSNSNAPLLNLTKEEKEWLDKKIAIKYVYDSNWAPFEWKDELEEHTGIIKDLLNLLEEKSKINFQQIPTQNWQESVRFMKENKADMYSAVGENSEKNSYLSFSKNVLFKTPFVFVSRIDDKNDYLETFDAIKGKNVAVLGTSTLDGILKDKKPNLSFLKVKSINEGFEKLRDKTLDVFMVNATAARYFINIKGYEDLKIATKIEFDLKLKLAVQKELPKEVLSILDKAIDTLSDKERSDIYRKWTEHIVEEVTDYTLVWKILVVVFVIIVLFIFYSRKLKIMVNEKTLELQELVKSLDEKVDERTKDLKTEKEFTQTLLDSQEQLIITTDGKTMISANKTFKDFYKIETIEEFKESYGECICDTFNPEAPAEYLQKMMGEETWIEYLTTRSYSKKTHKVIIKKDDQNYIFSVTAAVLPTKENLQSAVFTDITSLEEIRKEIEAIHKHTRESIEYASLIQGALIPESASIQKYFKDQFVIWNPKDTVGGDIYLFEELRDEDECLLMVIDCTGHGVPGAFVTMLVKAIERQITSKIKNSDEIVSPAKFLSIFNKNMKQLLRQETIDSVSNAGFDGGILYYNKKDKIIKFAGAETPLFYVEDGELKTIKGSRYSVGYKKCDVAYEYKEHTIEVKDDMQFYLTTDGYIDQNGGEKGFPFGKRQFTRIIEEHKTNTMKEQKSALLEELKSYQKDEDRNDDITVIGFRV